MHAMRESKATPEEAFPMPATPHNPRCGTPASVLLQSHVSGHRRPAALNSRHTWKSALPLLSDQALPRRDMVAWNRLSQYQQVQCASGQPPPENSLVRQESTVLPNRNAIETQSQPPSPLESSQVSSNREVVTPNRPLSQYL